MSLFLFLRGGCTVTVAEQHRTEAMNLCMQMGLQYTDFAWREDGSIQFACSVFSAQRFVSACYKQGVEVNIIAYRGVPKFLNRLRARTGLVVGAILAVALVVLSGLFVWDVQVSGNEELTEGEVIEALRACGFGVGSYLPSLRVREIENRVLMASECIGWLSINTEGTVARVQIIEHIAGERESSSKNPANLVAVSDGQIEYLELYRGNVVVTVGQAVKKGELLVSGLYDSKTGSFRYTRAAGRVMARTERVLTVEIPLLYEEKVYDEVYLQEIELSFFNFSQIFFKNSRNSDILCDIIKYNANLGQLGDNRLPVSLSRTEVRPYQLVERERSAEEALELCYAELAEQLSTISNEVQLLQKQIVTEVGEESVRLVCTLTCIEDIALVQEFEIVQ
ncbi:MAG: sporulation protein YqfD [Clostridia bacterium]|nr:sporulation protein YqfD [Clostridia bacterium]